jgi:chain length determinant protein tyrosine kinase EpsG
MQSTTEKRQQTIGDILMAAGKLTASQVAKIAEYQKIHSVSFGAAAKALQLATDEDIDFVLAKQYDYSFVSSRSSVVSAEVVVAFKPFSPFGENMRALRSQLMLRWFNQDGMRKVLAIVSPSKGDGRSFMAANLAVVFAQQGQKTLLIDANLRSPRQADLFRLPNKLGLANLLAERADFEQVIHRNTLMPSLDVITSGNLPPNPQELLGRPQFGQLLQKASQDYDVVLIDTPAATDYSDADIIAARGNAALLVARKDMTSLTNIKQLIERLKFSGVAVVGSVFNDE